MIKITFSQLIAVALFSLCLATAPAEATVDHTYVSGKGTDTGGCATPATACRTFAYAITQTAAAGEIIAIDAANYAPVTITQSISIVADAGGPAGIIMTSTAPPTFQGTAITINAGAADVVNLRGLTLDGEGTASVGIYLTSAGSLTISDCVVRHFVNLGIGLTGPLHASILNTVMTNNGFGLSVGGIGAAATFVTVRKSVMNNNFTGFAANYDAMLTFADSMATGNSLGGFVSLFSGPGSPAVVYSYGDNEINGNGTDISGGGTLTPVAKR
jgi:hypothetical protein